ncbi:MAG: ABC transporter ATP-binding protein, partial [Actinomycetales bacterium]
MAVPSKEPIISATGVYVSLGGMPVLRDVGIAVHPGELVVLTGGNGSGKTTFLKALLGLLPTTDGEITWFGTPLAQFRQWQRIGFVPQRGTLNTAQATVNEIVSSGLLPKRKLLRPL